jgi:tetratricopeptide (TPR) repeat protein
MEDDGEKRRRLDQLVEAAEEIVEGTQNPKLFLVLVQLQRAFTDMDQERYQSAADRLERIVDLDPENPAIFYNLGVVYTFLKREEEAAGQYETALKLRPDYSEAWYNLGQICLIKNKDFSKALNCFHRALAVRPDYVSAHYQQGVVWERLGDKNKALACWERTLQLDPENKAAIENIQRLRDESSE